MHINLLALGILAYQLQAFVKNKAFHRKAAEVYKAFSFRTEFQYILLI